MSDTGLLAGNSCSLNLISLKNVDNSLARSPFWEVHPNKPSLSRLPISEPLPIKFLWSFSMSCFSDLSSSWSPKFSGKLSSFSDISISCLGYICMEKTRWLVYVFICLMSLCVNFILFPHLGQIWTLVDNNVKILFRLRFGIISMKGRVEIVFRLEFLISQRQWLSGSSLYTIISWHKHLLPFIARVGKSLGTRV